MQPDNQPYDTNAKQKDGLVFCARTFFRWVLYIAVTALLVLFILNISPGITSNTKGSRSLPQRRPTKYQLCVISRVRNVPSLIPSWIEFNTLIGIEHFFVADDCSTDNTTHYWLKFYEKAGLLTPYFTQPLNNCSNHHPWEGYLLNYVFEQVRKEPLCAWIGVIDPDEYIVPISNASLKIYTSNPKHIYLRIPWLYMGHSAQQVEKNESKLSTFLCGDMCMFMKTFAREEVVKDWWSSHHPTYYDDKLTNQFGPHASELGILRPFEVMNNTVDGCANIPKHGIVIRHYFHLSFQEHMRVRANRKYNSYGGLLAQRNWTTNQHYTNWLAGNTTCTHCGRVGESNALLLAKQLNEHIVRKYGNLVTHPAYHIYRGVPFP